MPPSVAEAPARAKYTSRGFAVRLERTERLSETFLRLTFTGDDLDEFGATTLDQRIKLVLPASCDTPVDPALFADAEWYQTWLALPDGERPVMRTYTVRAVRTEAKEIDVDVVLHGVEPGSAQAPDCEVTEAHACVHAGEVGPAVRWSATARRGDSIVVIGPNGLFPGAQAGIEWRPPATAGSFLVAGDETAVPAISSIVAALPADARGHVFCEVPTSDDVLSFDAPPGVSVTWLARRGEGVTAQHGELLDLAVRAGAPRLLYEGTVREEFEDVDLDAGILWDVPEQSSAPEGVYAWIAGEATAVKELRRFLVRDLGMDRKAVAFMGYWRAGRSEGS